MISQSEIETLLAAYRILKRLSRGDSSVRRSMIDANTLENYGKFRCSADYAGEAVFDVFNSAAAFFQDSNAKEALNTIIQRS